MFTYAQANAALGKRETKKVANNTYMRKVGDNFIIRLHKTDIITILPNGHYILNSGGWRTNTTKERINRFTSARLYTQKYVWNLSHTTQYANGALTLNTSFFDGVEVDETGRVVNHDDNLNKVMLIQKQDEWIRKHIDAFMKDFNKMKRVPYPEVGDCLGCRETTTGGYLMDDCIISHLEKKYIHGSLVVRAMKWDGYSDLNISTWYSMMPVKRFGQVVRRFLWDFCQKNRVLIPVSVEVE